MEPQEFTVHQACVVFELHQDEGGGEGVIVSMVLHKFVLHLHCGKSWKLITFSLLNRHVP